MTLTTCNYTSKLNQARSTWHSGWWWFKSVIIIFSIASTLFLPLQIIQLYGELARIGAGIFLILQLISVIEFITWWNNYWMPEDDKMKNQSSNCFLGLFMSTLFYVASVIGIGMMYSLYVPKSSSCTLNIFFITWTAILLGVMMLVSLHSKVNRGLLSSGIMGSYIVFLCWSAIRSEPAGKKCSPQKEHNNKHVDWTNVLGFLIAISAIVMATFSTGIDSQTFQFLKEDDEAEEEKDDDDIPYEYGFFHLVFSLGTMYFAMLFISWNLESSTNNKWSMDVGWASTWVKIVNEWLAATIYLWKLIYPALKQTGVENNQLRERRSVMP
ncbi:serine incorporator 3-like [Impatiens glandulifera]|uniref:serine incorporator 3-like n=1 Tax=Impatiens glandulifera TaxID=253017 RepID=UPI001FB17CF9|nr:serine incorporator 3-like [Impatiens glandulifera]